MNIHGCARSFPSSRQLLVQRIEQEGYTVKEVAESIGLSERSGYKWLRRYRLEGLGGLLDHSSRPQRQPHRTEAKRVQLVLKHRESRMNAHSIAHEVQMKRSTVSRWLAHQTGHQA